MSSGGDWVWLDEGESDGLRWRRSEGGTCWMWWGGDKGGLKAEEDMISSGSEGHLEAEVVCER